MKKVPQDICVPIPARRFDLRRRRYQMLKMWYGDERAVVEISAHTAQPKKIDLLLDDVLGRIRRPENGIIIRMKGQWSSIIGSMFSRFCEPESLRDGVLTLKVKHSALLVELKPSSDLICKKINTVFGENVCREVRLRV